MFISELIIFIAKTIFEGIQVQIFSLCRIPYAKIIILCEVTKKKRKKLHVFYFFYLLRADFYHFFAFSNSEKAEKKKKYLVMVSRK